MCSPLKFKTNHKTYSVSLINLATLFSKCEELGINNLQDIDLRMQDVTRLMIKGISNDIPIAELTKLLRFMDELSLMFKESFDEVMVR